jgi:hypothetical protein
MLLYWHQLSNKSSVLFINEKREPIMEQCASYFAVGPDLSLLSKLFNNQQSYQHRPALIQP